MAKAKKRDSTNITSLDRAFRVVFERRGDELKLVSVQRLRMRVPPPQALYPTQSMQGSWFELRDKKGRPVYRRVIEDPLQDLEVVCDDPERPLQRIQVEDLRDAFFLIVPDIKGARRLVVNSAARERRVAKPEKRGKGVRKAAEPTPFEFHLSKRYRKER